MAPIVFITVVSCILIAMLYWVLSSGEPSGKKSFSSHRRFQWEAAQELFVRDDPESYLPANQMRISRLNTHEAVVYWNIPSDKWREIIKKPRHSADPPAVFLKFYQTHAWLKTWDLPLKQNIGHYHFTLPADTACYCSIGYKKNHHFIPLLTSNTVMHQS